MNPCLSESCCFGRDPAAYHEGGNNVAHQSIFILFFCVSVRPVVCFVVFVLLMNIMALEGWLFFEKVIATLVKHLFKPISNLSLFFDST